MRGRRLICGFPSPTPTRPPAGSGARRRMDSTSHTLLQQARAGSQRAWARLDALYRPFLRGWLRAHGFAHAEADDLTQDVLLTVVRDLGGFAHPGATGAFRGWL